MTTSDREKLAGLTDQETEDLLDFPDVLDAVTRYQAIQSQYRDALVGRLRADADGDTALIVKSVFNEFQPRLDEQKRVIREVALRHLTA